MTLLLVGLYLAAIVAANLIVAHFGPSATIPTAFVLRERVLAGYEGHWQQPTLPGRAA